MTAKELFKANSAFCSDCGSILPLLGEIGNVVCYMCENSCPAENFANNKVQYTIHFNSVEVCTKNQKDERDRKKIDSGSADGPLVDRKCPKCNNDKMSYATLQLRSADEGQTVFYTCTKCKHKENENS